MTNRVEMRLLPGPDNRAERGDSRLSNVTSAVDTAWAFRAVGGLGGAALASPITNNHAERRSLPPNIHGHA
jgi:hypothetical protein